MPLRTFLKKNDPLLSVDCPLLESIEDWKLYLSEPDDEEWIKKFRILSRTGRPAGGEYFINMIEKILRRTLKPKQPGRSKLKKNNADNHIDKPLLWSASHHSTNEQDTYRKKQISDSPDKKEHARNLARGS